jgi:subtilisin-like proprotein convertase family protein
MRCCARFSHGLIAAALVAVASPAGAQAVTTFSNATPILINDGVVATPSPSNITVAGLTGQVVKVRVALNHFSHNSPIDVNVWLIAPGGTGIVLMGRLPYASMLSDAMLQFDDCAPRNFSNQGSPGTTMPSGRYRPGSHQFASTSNIPPPAGVTSFPQSQLSAFNGSGSSRNGTWSLYVSDVSTNGVTGTIAGGWSVTFYTQPTAAVTSLALFSMGCQGPDYDGDGRSDTAVYRPVTGEWFIFQSATNSGTVVPWGAPASSGAGDIAVPADYDGDGQTDVAVYRQATGTWYIRQSFTGGTVVVAFGAPASLGLADTPVPGDYDGDGQADIAIYRAGTGEWLIRNSGGGGITVRTWGAPALGDYPARR